MAYAEFLRARRSLAWVIGVLAAGLLLAFSFGHDAQVVVNGTSVFGTGMAVPLGQLAPIAMFFAAVYASTAGTSLNRENLTRDISWTKPVSRTLLALQFIAIDVAAVAVVFALAMLAVLAVLLRFHFAPLAGATLVAQLALGLGASTMWYALLQVLSCAFGPGARSLGGILWPVALAGIALASVAGPLGMAVRGFDVINPLAYMSGIIGNGTGVHANSVWQAPVEMRALIVWFFSLLFCALALAIWPRREA